MAKVEKITLRTDGGAMEATVEVREGLQVGKDLANMILGWPEKRRRDLQILAVAVLAVGLTTGMTTPTEKKSASRRR